MRHCVVGVEIILHTSCARAQPPLSKRFGAGFAACSPAVQADWRLRLLHGCACSMARSSRLRASSARRSKRNGPRLTRHEYDDYACIAGVIVRHSLAERAHKSHEPTTIERSPGRVRKARALHVLGTLRSRAGGVRGGDPLGFARGKHGGQGRFVGGGLACDQGYPAAAHSGHRCLDAPGGAGFETTEEDGPGGRNRAANEDILSFLFATPIRSSANSSGTMPIAARLRAGASAVTTTKRGFATVPWRD